MPRSATGPCGACSRTKAYAPRAPQSRRRLAACLTLHATLFSALTRLFRPRARFGSLYEVHHLRRGLAGFDLDLNRLTNAELVVHELQRVRTGGQRDAALRR